MAHTVLQTHHDERLSSEDSQALLERRLTMLRQLVDEAEQRVRHLVHAHPKPFSRIHWRRWARHYTPFRLTLDAQYAPRPLAIPPHYRHEPTFRGPWPRISMVTASFNQGAFLEDTLRSILDQDYPELEYVVQDGGSQDHTPHVLWRYRRRLHHVEAKPDQGQTHALNLGFHHCTGDILGYLNADDLLLPGTLHAIASYFARHPEVDVVYGQRVLIDRWGLEIGRWILPSHRTDTLLWADYVPQETLFWRRSLWQRVGNYLDERYNFAMDWELLDRFRRAGANMVRLPRFLGAFRVHAAQKSSAQITEGLVEMDRLRERMHQRVVGCEEASLRLIRFTIEHAWLDTLYRRGLLTY